MHTHTQQTKANTFIISLSLCLTQSDFQLAKCQPNANAKAMNDPPSLSFSLSLAHTSLTTQIVGLVWFLFAFINSFSTFAIVRIHRRHQQMVFSIQVPTSKRLKESAHKIFTFILHFNFVRLARCSCSSVFVASLRGKIRVFRVCFVAVSPESVCVFPVARTSPPDSAGSSAPRRCSHSNL